MVKFDTLVGKFVLSAIMISCLFLFIIVMQEKDGSVDPISEDPIFNQSFSALSKSIDQSNEESESKYNVFISEEPKAGFGSIVLFGIVSVGKSFSNIVFSFFGAIIKLPLFVLGIPATIYSLILTWLIIIVIVSVWLLYKLGG